ncbi:MAG: methionyl-tRNA formyltransferase [Candidatus Gracilibacteria bacterium]|nr:methionyl-tRNA formyltransferase [Candidatus Gracilibacteria bacterium]
MNLIFLGTPQFVCPILEALHQEFNVVAVITQPDKPIGRKQILTAPPVKIKAEELKIPVLQPEKISDILNPKTPNNLRGLNIPTPDFLVTAAYGQYLPTKILKLPKTDALNIHPSLLPQYRGATPMQSALLSGSPTTGVSIIRMVKAMDAGPVFAKRVLDIDPEWKYPDLEKAAANIGTELMIEVIKKYDSITPIHQDARDASHCEKISKKDGEINFSKETAKQIHNKLRAFTPWPGTYTWLNKQKLSLLEFTPKSELQTPNSPGTIFQQENETHIACKTGSIIITSLQLAGKKPTDIKSFLNGQSTFSGTNLPS